MWTGVDSLAVVIPVDSRLGLLTIVGTRTLAITISVSVVVVATAVATLVVVAASLGAADVRES